MKASHLAFAVVMAFKAHLAEYRAKYPEPRVVFVGATVYRSKNAAPRTLVRYWYGANAEPVTFWSTADFALMSGILSFVGTDGHTRSLFMMWGNVDIERTAARYASIGREYHAPVIPDFPKGPATFSFVGNQPPAGVLVPIQWEGEIAIYKPWPTGQHQPQRQWRCSTVR